jgi:HAE1 family hydrophobic/amphiphilic exporter-1
MQAALDGSREIGFTIVSMTLSLAAVFIPSCSWAAWSAALLHEFAVVIGVSVLVSGFVSLTLTPMACSRFLRHSAAARTPVLSSRSASSRACSICTRSRSGTCSAPMLTAVFVLTLSATGYLFMSSRRDSFPPRTRADLRVHGGGPGHLLRRDDGQAAAGGGDRQENPYVQEFFSGIGASGSSTVSNTGRIFMRLKPRSERPPAEQIIQEMRPQFAVVTA